MNSSQPMSIREIAQELGKSPAAVGEHMATLQKVGLVISAGTRKRRSRTEALYVNKSRAISFTVTKQSAAAVAAYAQRFQAQMRRVTRQHADAQKAVHKQPEFDNFVNYRWANAHVTPEAAALVKQRIEELVRLVVQLNQPDPDLRTEEHVRVTFTGLLLPSQAESRKAIKRK